MSVFSNDPAIPRRKGPNIRRRCSSWWAGASRLSILRETPAAASRAVEGLSAEHLRRPEAPGKWSIAQVLQHLADSDLVWGWRMRLILAQDRPVLTGYDQDLWADRLHYANADPAHALETLHVLRRGNLALIDARHARRSQARRRPCRAWRRKRRVFDRLIRRPRPAASSTDRSDSRSCCWRAGRKVPPLMYPPLRNGYCFEADVVVARVFT